MSEGPLTIGMSYDFDADDFVPSELKWSEGAVTNIGLGVSEMDFGTSEEVRSAVVRAIKDGVHGYLTPQRASETVKAFTFWQANTHGWDVDERVVKLLPDSATAIVHIMQYLVDPRWPIVIISPCYPKFEAAARSLGRVVINVSLGDWQTGYRLDSERVSASLHGIGPALVILCNPHNPTGRVFTLPELEGLASVVAKNGGSVLSDEVHSALTFAPAEHIPFELVAKNYGIETFTLCSTTKAWNTSGLKCAELVLPHRGWADRWDAHTALSVASGATSTLGAIAAGVAYSANAVWPRAVQKYLDSNRHVLSEFISERLPRSAYVIPDASFAAWVGLGAYIPRDVPFHDLSSYISIGARVTVDDGSKYGSDFGDHIRISFATSQPVLLQALKRISDLVNQT
ncbi:aminotransferase class I/II-fold pyridoxal phosphate-dependent enzyme [Rhodococcus sp. AQ5-07]|uniref:aminotransferase class I/II-fold pyridoxal phosphate-dependent enzyme n=1 Tax=Rhodococcus sp. AQ5-07 TaxID=2054902 RepID=UPI000DBF6575|nr:aminotransferase class I/II-fold pyridoxal phosphate-dependent enzyme [Rhodococcus sp. AQ5-07]RAL30920.1 hypothetical protein CVN56_30345 [Rhodococcus sp. AQ5-07]